MRRAHHGFQNWLEADKDIYGVDYRGHRKGSDHRIAKGQEKNPLVAGSPRLNRTAATTVIATLLPALSRC